MKFPLEATPVGATAIGRERKDLSGLRASDRQGKASVPAQEVLRHFALFRGLRTRTTTPSPFKQREAP